MADYTLPYGRGTLPLRLPDEVDVEWLLPAPTPAADDPARLIAAALDAPVAGPPLRAWREARTAAIAINDKTRPVPHDLLLPPLLERLESLGLPPEAITLIIATGTHVPTRPEAFGAVVPPEVLARYPVISHDCDAGDLVGYGNTARGTPVWLNRRYAEADLRIVVGNVEPHHFAGFSGGVKSAAIGLAGRATISANHALLRDPHATLARYKDNPLRQDIEEIGQRIEVQFALNAVMNDDKQIVAAFAGMPRTVEEAAIPRVREIYQVAVEEPFDVMITSPGGYPKDINLYQAHKAVSCANRVTRAGGEIILVAACEDGEGSAGYVAWMEARRAEGVESHAEVMARFVEEPFRIGPHKAFIFARDAVRVNHIWIVSEIPPERVRRLLLPPASLEEAVAAALKAQTAGRPVRVGIMPYANATIPDVKT